MTSKAGPGGSRMERKKEETKKKIVSVAIGLFQEQGIDATTMEHIAEEADIAKGTLYNYFPVKEAILSEYIQRSFKEKNSARIMQLQNLPDTRARIILILSMLVEGVQAQKEIFEKYLVYQMQKVVSLHKDDGVKSGIRLLATEIIQLGQKSGEIRDDLSIDILADLFEFVFIEVVKQFYMEPQNFNADKVIAGCVDLFINGVKPQSHK